MDNSRIFIISDTHFFHRNVIKYCDRPFSSVEEMNEQLIKNWNSVVTKNDRVFMLGDFCLSGKDNVIKTGQALNGRKTLILGNHDSASLKTYYEAGFEMVSKHPILLNDFYILSHKPPFIPDYSFYYYIYGHIHNKEVADSLDNKRSFCVSAELINYTPIEFKEVIKQIKRKEIDFAE